MESPGTEAGRSKTMRAAHAPTGDRSGKTKGVTRGCDKEHPRLKNTFIT
jgi:hypothetical protein